MEREPDIDAAIETLPARTPPIDARELGAIMTGGFLGAMLRAGLEEALGAAPSNWPWATFAVNIVASALLGYLIASLGERPPRTTYARALLATGVCGALSTFSTVMLELLQLAEHAGIALACGYGAASVAGGLAAVALGSRLASRAAGAPR